MERLDFLLPDFTRVMWVTEKARAVWSPRLQRIGGAWAQIERLSVLEGLRQAALQNVAPEVLPDLSAWAARNRLVALPLGVVGGGAAYQATPQPVQPGKPFEYRVAVVRPESAPAFVDAFQSGNDEAIGQLLGYPACCRAFFREVWVEQKFVDTTWPMAEETFSARADGDERVIFPAPRLFEIKGTPPESNILLRWIGVRAVPHLPHSFTCEATVEFGRKLLALGEASGFGEEVAWIREMLRWPVEWSALHGIAEIKTPILKVSARTDATGEKYVVRYHGDLYPEEGVQGLVFPFRLPKGRKLTETTAYRKALEPGPSAAVETEPNTATNTVTNSATTQQVVELSAVLKQAPDREPVIGTPAYYLDNGFSSLEAQERAHEVVLAAIVEACRGLQQPKVLDLGCGNGALLAKAQARVPGLIPFGVEIRQEAAMRWPQVVGPHWAGHYLWIGDMFAFAFGHGWYDVALLMPGRLLERSEQEATAFFDRLRAHVGRLVVYAYGDWLRRYGGLRELWAATRMPGRLTMVAQGDDAAAGLVTFDES